jgi:NAD(P)-dependent dehydrogenase (short-subunit alcohol dehydrogenase family)
VREYETLRVNLHPAVQATQTLPPGMRERGWGRTVNISSLIVLGFVDRTAYAAAKSTLSTSETNRLFSLIFDYQFKIA